MLSDHQMSIETVLFEIRLPRFWRFPQAVMYVVKNLCYFVSCLTRSSEGQYIQKADVQLQRERWAVSYSLPKYRTAIQKYCLIDTGDTESILPPPSCS